MEKERLTGATGAKYPKFVILNYEDASANNELCDHVQRLKNTDLYNVLMQYSSIIYLRGSRVLFIDFNIKGVNMLFTSA